MRAKPIDPKFFLKYAGSPRSYAQVYRDYSYSDECAELFNADGAPRVRRVCVLGTATGVILKDLHKAFGVKPYGCELSPWAFEKTPSAYRARVRNQDMREYVAAAKARKEVFDLTFSNSLIYLPPRDLAGFLADLSTTTRYLHFRSSFKGEACVDPYRTILKSYAWWNRQLEQAGFIETRNLFGSPTYLWRSKRRK